MEAADQKHEFWKVLTACFTDFPTNLTVWKTNCTGSENETTLNSELMMLSEYDLFVLEKILVANDGNMSSDLFRGGLDIGHYYLKDTEHFSNLVLQQDKFVEEFCHNGGGCDVREVDRDLKNFVSQIMFLLKGWVTFIFSREAF